MGKTNQSFYDPAKTYDDNFDDGPTDVSPEIKVKPDTGTPKFSFLGQPLYSPFGIAAGPLPNSKYIKYVFEHGFDGVVYKTQRTIEFKVNQFPNVLYLDIEGDLTIEKSKQPLIGKMESSAPKEKFSITNSFGNPSRGPGFWVPDTKKAISYENSGQLLISSSVGTIKEGFSDEDYFNDFAEAAKLSASTGARVIEVNLSCPNVASEGVLCYTKSSVVAICKKVRDAIGDLPLIVKFGYFSTDQDTLLSETINDIAPFISAISVINTIPAPVVDERGNQALPGPNRLMSGVCGASIKWAGLEMVNRLDKLRKNKGYKYEIVGVGGVMTPKDFNDYRGAGADLVQSCTGAMWNPNLAAEIKATL